MSDTRQNQIREFRLEGVGLIVIAAALLASFLGAFYLGRWYERRSTPLDALVGAGQDPLGQLAQVGPESDVGTDLTFFDSLSEGTVAESRREAAPAEPSATPGAGGGPGERRATPAPASAGAAGGPFYVQVFAGRDRRSAAELQGKLRSTGYNVEVDAESDGSVRLYKVRVVGYPDRAAADAAADALRGEGFPSAFVRRR